MFKVQKKDTRAASITVFMSVDFVLVSFFVNSSHISHRSFSNIFIVNFEQIDTNWE